MKQKKTNLTERLLLDFGQIVCNEIMCRKCPQKNRCDIWRYQPEVKRKLAEWYLGKLGYFKVAK